jgi:tRNA(Met) cytidine acetyltransferase
MVTQTQERTGFLKAIGEIGRQAQAVNQRAVIVLSGEHGWCLEHAAQVENLYQGAIVDWFSKDKTDDVSHKQHFQASLGREVDLLIFPLIPNFDANRLTAMSGMIRGGGLLVLLLTKELWNSASHFDQRFIHALHQEGIHWLQQNRPSNINALEFSVNVADSTLPPASMQSRLRRDLGLSCVIPGIQQQTSEEDETKGREAVLGHPAHNNLFLDPRLRRNDETKKLYLNEQAELVEKIHQVCQAERATVVINSDRGRGKSAALGIAAARWLAAGEDVYLTGPSLKSVEQVFWHAQQALPQAELGRGRLSYQGQSLKFLPPDAVHTEYNNIKRLLVDEAATVPIPKLSDWLQHIPQLVFSTTIHGYEGTGKGFLLKFGKVLDQERPGWKKLTLQHPIRWASDDFLEEWLNKTFLLDADIGTVPTSFPVKETTTVIPSQVRIQDQTATTIDKTLAVEYLDSGFDVDSDINHTTTEGVSIARFTGYELANDEKQLQQIYGLLINAHYRTTPKDLRYLLDSDGASIYAICFGPHLLAAAWVMYEGEFDEELADAVYLGTRRPAGHLLAQSLTYHCAIRDAAIHRYARIVRIAVHPQCQRQGWGSQLVQYINKCEHQVDAIGTSFSATPEGLRFWQKNGFMPVRIGMSRHQASGEHSVMLLHPVTEIGQAITDKARTRMLDALPYHLQEPLADLDDTLVEQVTGGELTTNQAMSEDDWQELALFAYANRTYAETLGPLSKLLPMIDQSEPILSEQQRTLLLQKVGQHLSWEAVVLNSGLEGKRQAIEILRASVEILLHHYGPEELNGNIDSL